MEARLFRQSTELTRLDYRKTVNWSWVMTGYQGDALNPVEALSRVGVGGIQFGLGTIEQPRRIVVTMDVQGVSYAQLHAAIAELESHLRWRDGLLELHMRRDSLAPWNEINVICEQLDVQVSTDEQYRAQVTIRFATRGLYWREPVGVFGITNPPIFGVRAVTVDLSTMTFATITGIDETVTQIDYRPQSNEWIVFGASKVWRAPFTGGAATLIGQATGATALRGCVDQSGNIMCVAQGLNQLLRFTYPSSAPVVLGTFNATPVRVRMYGEGYVAVGEFSQYGSVAGLAGVIFVDVNGTPLATIPLFSTSDIFPGGGRVRDVFYSEGVYVAIANRVPAPSQSWVSVASAQVPYYYVAQGSSSWAPFEIDQSSTIDEVRICADSAIHAGRTFGTLCTLRDLASIVPMGYPAASIGGIQDGMAVERYLFATSEPRRVFRLKDGAAMPLFVSNSDSFAIRRVGNRACVGFAVPATVIPPLTLDVSTIANTGATAEIVPFFSVQDKRCWGMYSKCDDDLIAEICDPDRLPGIYEPKHQTTSTHGVLPGTRYDKLFRGSGGGNIPRYWFAMDSQINANLTVRRYKHDWR